MNEMLIRNWNETVQSDDLVYVLGDFTLSRRIEVIENLVGRLNGHKILIM
jgi:calcineurin-like phosphoesterase family protein